MLASVRWNVGNVCDVIHTHTEVMAPIDRLGDELGGPHRNTGHTTEEEEENGLKN
jgi:hypothetical protein